MNQSASNTGPDGPPRIADAPAAVGPGASVIRQPGIYREELRIIGDVTLVAKDGPDTVTLRAPDGVAVFVGRGPLVLEDCVIQAVDGHGTGPGTVRNSTIENYGPAGVRLAGARMALSPARATPATTSLTHPTELCVLSETPTIRSLTGFAARTTEREFATVPNRSGPRRYDFAVQPLAKILVGIVAVIHAYIVVLEMFLWRAAHGRKVFRTTPEFAAETATLAANQGLYNGFLAAGLTWSLIADDFAFAVFFLVCVMVAGAYGAVTVNRRILAVQTMPAALALIATLLAR